jgi:hypothetical protein
MVVTPASKLRFHISQGWGMVWYSEVLVSLSPQTSSRPSLAKPLSTHDLQHQTLRVDASYLHNSLDVTSRLLSCLKYGVLLLRLHRWCQDQIWLSLLAQSNWAMCGIDVYIELKTMSFSDSLGSCCIRTQLMTDSCTNYQNIPSRKPVAYLPEFGWLA